MKTMSIEQRALEAAIGTPLTLLRPDRASVQFPDGIGLETNETATDIWRVLSDQWPVLRNAVLRHGHVSMRILVPPVAPYKWKTIPDAYYTEPWHTDAEGGHIIGLYCASGSRQARTGLAHADDVLKAVHAEAGRIDVSVLDKNEKAAHAIRQYERLREHSNAATLSAFTNGVNEATRGQPEKRAACVEGFWIAVGARLTAERRVHWQRWQTGQMMLMSGGLMHAKEATGKPEPEPSELFRRVWLDMESPAPDAESPYRGQE